MHSLLSRLVRGLTGLQQLSLNALRGIDDHVVASVLAPNLPQVRDLDLSLTAVGTLGVHSLRACPCLESLRIIYCAMVSYAAVLTLRDACPRLKLIRRLPEWLEGQFDTPWGELHTYYPCGAFSFTRDQEAVGWVAQLRQHGGSTASLGSCAHKVDEAGGWVTTHVEDRLVYVDLEPADEPLNGSVGVCVTPRDAEHVLVVQSRGTRQPPRHAHPVLLSGYGRPEPGESVEFGSLAHSGTMVSCMRVRPLEAGGSAPPAGVEAALRNFFLTRQLGDTELHAFLSVHCMDLCDRGGGQLARFAVGDWFARGVPGPEPPADGVPTCTRRFTREEYKDVDCWGRCTADDLVTVEGRTMIEHVVRALAGNVTNLLSVVPEVEPLQFEVSAGSYQNALELKGYQSEERCASDCTLITGVHVAPSYCDVGVEADAVLSVTRPPIVDGVAGTGSFCQSSAENRPTWLVFAWLGPTDDAGTPAGGANGADGNAAGAAPSLDELVERYKPLVLHELIHALGFTSNMFLGARDAAGVRKELLELRPVADLDGETDEVWTFTSGRAWESGMRYFGCDDPAVGLPLMGAPEMGRASHWETRILRDDVMSYGGRALVSSVTLAAMEDLGFYLANYSAADCISWGRGAGCAYVRTRCGEPALDQSASPASADECVGDPRWPVDPAQADYLAAKCAHGVSPCADLVTSGYSSLGGARVCNAQCFSGARSDCKAALAPTTQLEEAAPTEFMGMSISASYMQWIMLGVYILVALVAALFTREYCCPQGGSLALMLAISGALVFVGLAAALLCAMVVWDVDVHAKLTQAAAHAKAVGGRAAVLSVGVGFALLSANGLTTCVGLCLRRRGSSRGFLLCSLAFWVLILIAQLLLAGFVTFYIVVMDNMAADSLATLQGAEGGGRHSDSFMGGALAEIEGIACRTYQRCCRDPALGEEGVSERTCVQGHGGTGSSLMLASEDPSQAVFCEYISGSEMTATLPEGVCELLELIPDLEDCTTGFCTLGVDGYFVFIDALVTVVVDNAQYVIGVALLLVLASLVMIVNLFRLQRTMRRQREEQRATTTEERGAAIRPYSDASSVRTTAYGEPTSCSSAVRTTAASSVRSTAYGDRSSASAARTTASQSRPRKQSVFDFLGGRSSDKPVPKGPKAGRDTMHAALKQMPQQHALPAPGQKFTDGSLRNLPIGGFAPDVPTPAGLAGLSKQGSHANLAKALGTSAPLSVLAEASREERQSYHV